ncbi:MAG TPA: hypothetical protein VD761_08570 [Solirubrobacterales bacterium]|nr:hypothetical protein [Solirubrobacterales bacterium]
MKTTSNFRPIASVMAVALAALLLLAPGATAAKVPPLASTAQYKAFVDYVNTLRELRAKPATAAKKASYEQRLTAKHQAAVNKSNALFQRVKALAKAETQRQFQVASKKIRLAESAELADLRADYADKLTAARDILQRDVGAVENKFDARYATLNRQITRLRVEKAKAKALPKKVRIQEQINVLIKEIGDSRTQEREAITKLKDRYAERRTAILAAKQAATTKVREAREEDVEEARARWNRAAARQLDDDRVRRSNQLTNLEVKLQAGRGYIASMPVSG